MDELAFIVNEPDDEEESITYHANEQDENQVPDYVYDLLEALYHQSATTIDFKNHRVPKEVAVWVRRAVDAGFVSSWRGGVVND